jgi:hypothetical protein
MLTPNVFNVIQGDVLCAVGDILPSKGYVIIVIFTILNVLIVIMFNAKTAESVFYPTQLLDVFHATTLISIVLLVILYNANYANLDLFSSRTNPAYYVPSYSKTASIVIKLLACSVKIANTIYSKMELALLVFHK